MTVPHLPVGSFVRFWPNAEHVGEGRLTRTTSAVQLVDGEPFVSVEGIPGQVPVRHLEVVNTWSGHPRLECGVHWIGEDGTWCWLCDQSCAPGSLCLGCTVAELRERLAEVEHKAARYRLAWQNARRRASELDHARRAARATARLHARARDRAEAIVARAWLLWRDATERIAGGHPPPDLEKFLADLGDALTVRLGRDREEVTG